MKSFKIILTLFTLVAMLTSCEHKVAMNTVVYKDGSLDKTITIEGDSANIDENFMGVVPDKGWHVTILNKDSTKKSDQEKLILQFSKHFKNSEEANSDLGNPNDTLFRVTSRFDKKLKWFYTYVRYSDTYHAINRLQEPISDYFTFEDFAFINRLPAEGSSISKADSLYLDRLNDKIFDVYGSHALFEEYYQRLEELLKSENEIAWLDTLKNHKEKLFESLQSDKQIEDLAGLLKKAGISNLPLQDQEFIRLQQEMESITNFISKASNGKYIHAITMPYRVIYSNADSIKGNTLYWKPSSTKFLLKDYEMVGEARTLNNWAIVVSIGFILLSIVLMFYKRRPKTGNNLGNNVPN
ncbi:MAG: hypothetical protein JNM78_13670 [Cyclobacteriaceae bacterium]|nr:hypothetical protein [Cyclobacteriaceae bacterium]